MSEKADEFRKAFPEAVKTVAQFAVDNPMPVVLITAAFLVTKSAARNLVNPVSVAEIIALDLVVNNLLLPYGAKYVIDHGLIKVNVRDEDGKLIPFDPEKGRKLKVVS